MKTIINRIGTTIKDAKEKTLARITRASARACVAEADVRAKLREQNGEFVVEHGAVMLIILVVAALAIVLLKNLLNDTLAPTIQEKMLEFFN